MTEWFPGFEVFLPTTGWVTWWNRRAPLIANSTVGQHAETD